MSSKHNSKLICSVKSCGKKHEAKGYCVKHYKQFKKYGKIIENTVADFNILIDKESYYEIILTNNNLEEIGRAKFDKEDLNKIKSIGRWSLHSEGYVVNYHNNIYMHRLVMNAQDGDYVDHKKVGFKYKSDNRKSKLRICTNAENNSNKDKPSNNTSGYKGVTWDKANKNWLCRITYNGKNINIGRFKDAKSASEAYNKKAKQLQGRFFYKKKAH